MANSYPASPSLATRFVTVRIDDVSTAGSVWVVPGFRGEIKKISTVLDGAITTADAAITVEIGGVAVTGGAITVANSGSAAGTVDTAVPTAANTFGEAQAVEVITDGGSSGTRSLMVTLECEPV